MTVVDDRSGRIVFRAGGRGVAELFAGEVGGHRWQRTPPTERHGRVQSSTITVAVLSLPDTTNTVIDHDDLEIRTCRSSGAGGQKVNKRDTAVQITHRPTGLMVRCESERSQHRNREIALAEIAARLGKRERDAAQASRAGERRGQVGSGMRADKRRTVRCQDGSVTDHLSGRTWRLRDYLKGEW